MNVEFWNERYQGDGYFYGTQPNSFVKQCAPRIPPGKVLCLAEGEGRNAVFLARAGYAVTALDQSDVGLKKAGKLAAEAGVGLQTVVANLASYEIEPGAWSGIIATFAHLPPPLRARVHRKVVAGLKAGGVYVLEAYTPAQLRYNTGGPKDVELLMNLRTLREELAGLTLLVGQEIERDVREEPGHSGLSAVVQVLAQR